MTIAYIGLGANLHEPHLQLLRALTALDLAPDITLLRNSRFFKNKPMGPANQPDFINTVAEIDTTLSCRELLIQLQAIEKRHGRTRNLDRWGPRIIDLDIVAFGQEQIDEPDLSIPHYGCFERAFVLYPLAELVPDYVFPGGEKLQDLLASVPNDLEPLA